MINFLDSSRVSIYQGESCYPRLAPFHPGASFPEYPFGPEIACEPNPAYFSVREAFRLLGLDSDHYDDYSWNPLGSLISPGDTVLLKPNLIREGHAARPEEWQQVITHGSLIRGVLDYVMIALKGRGRIIIADGPQTDSDFEAICRRNGLDEILHFYRQKGLQVELFDLRRDRWFQKGDVIYKRVELLGDPAGYTTVDLGDASEFSSYALNGLFYGADYDMEETAYFHSNGKHVYLLCRSVMDADVIINLPKMKTHKKTGVTLSLKNMVGINGYRNCLPHFTIGAPDDGGDEFPSTTLPNKLQSRAVVSFKRLMKSMGGVGGGWARMVKRVGSLVFGDTSRVIRSGNWHGNDTAWRMVLDLNKILFYFDGLGQPRKKPLSYLTVVDGIIAGEGDGPVSPTALGCGLVVAGFNPVAVDTTCAALMGFNYRKIPMLERAWQIQAYPLAGFEPEQVTCSSNIPGWNGPLPGVMSSSRFHFEPHLGWKGQIELVDQVVG